MATHSSVLAWRTPGTAEPGGLPSMGSHRVGHDWSDLAAAAQGWRPGFSPCVWKIPWRRKWQPTPVLLPEKSHGQRSLVGYSPWGRKELDKTERLHFVIKGTSKCLILLDRKKQMRKERHTDFSRKIMKAGYAGRILLQRMIMWCTSIMCGIWEQYWRIQGEERYRQVFHPRQQEVREPVHRCAVWFSENADVLLNVDASGQAEEFQSTPACQLLLWFCWLKEMYNIKVENSDETENLNLGHSLSDFSRCGS